MNSVNAREKTTGQTHVQRLIDDHFEVRDRELCVSGVGVSELISAYGSPLFVYDESVINRQLNRLRNATHGRADIFYSMKANPSQRILKTLLNSGCGIEIASAGELDQALHAGCPSHRILFAGPGKLDSELELAVTAGIREIHVESVAEAIRLNDVAQRIGRTARIALRINPKADAQGGAMRMGGKPAPFGIDEECLDQALTEILNLQCLTIQGVHLFTGTQILDADTLIVQYRRALQVAEQVARRIPGALQSIDFGGGLGIPYFDRESPLHLEHLAARFPEIVLDADSNPLLSTASLILEPGRFLVGESGLYLCRVIEVKESRGKMFAITDGGMHHHLAASGNLGQTIKRNYPIAILNRLGEPPAADTDVVGPLCTPLDVLGRGVSLPALQPGDIVGVFQSGAYGRSSSPAGFLSHPAAAEVMVGDGKHELIRRRGSSEDYLQHQLLVD